MLLSKKISLLFLSLVCFLVASGQATSLRYSFDMTIPKGHLSGIMITKLDDCKLTGVIINEFGVSALSFVYDTKKRKIKLLDMMKMIDKWYIRRQLKSDLSLCLEILLNDSAINNKRNYSVSVTDSSTTVTNTKRKITYTFQPIESDSENETTE